jgi:hypothetical protein
MSIARNHGPSGVRIGIVSSGLLMIVMMISSACGSQVSSRQALRCPFLDAASGSEIDGISIARFNPIASSSAQGVAAVCGYSSSSGIQYFAEKTTLEPDEQLPSPSIPMDASGSIRLVTYKGVLMHEVRETYSNQDEVAELDAQSGRQELVIGVRAQPHGSHGPILFAFGPVEAIAFQVLSAANTQRE